MASPDSLDENIWAGSCPGFQPMCPGGSVKRMGLEGVLRSDALTRPLVSLGGTSTKIGSFNSHGSISAGSELYMKNYRINLGGFFGERFGRR
jgi:hypothetical protein